MFEKAHTINDEMTVKQSNYIKSVAVLTMLMDHIGVVLFPDIFALRAIGRVAFPLFAYQLGVGYLNTKNRKKYFARIFLFGIAIQGIYAFGVLFCNIEYDVGKLNIFFTLALGLAAIYCYDNNKFVWLTLILSISPLLRFCGIHLDYGIYGILLILILYIKRNCLFSQAVHMLILNAAYCAFTQNHIQAYSMLSLIFIAKQYNLKLSIPGIAFYLFYPLHLALLYLIKTIVEKF